MMKIQLKSKKVRVMGTGRWCPQPSDSVLIIAQNKTAGRKMGSRWKLHAQHNLKKDDA